VVRLGYFVSSLCGSEGRRGCHTADRTAAVAGEEEEASSGQIQVVTLLVDTLVAVLLEGALHNLTDIGYC